MALLENARNSHVAGSDQLTSLSNRLQEINGQLWDVEDRLRELEAAKDFGSDFIELARSVYQINDNRARTKREINDLLGAALVEEKSYAAY